MIHVKLGTVNLQIRTLIKKKKENDLKIYAIGLFPSVHSPFQYALHVYLKLRTVETPSFIFFNLELLIFVNTNFRMCQHTKSSNSTA